MKKLKSHKKSFEQKLQSAAYRYTVSVRNNRRAVIRKDKENDQFITYQEETKMNKYQKTYSVEQIIECVNNLPIDTIEIVDYHVSSVDIKYGEDLYIVTEQLVAYPSLSKSNYLEAKSLYTEARVLSMCLETAANCLFNRYS